MALIYLGIGSNIEPQRHIKKALAILNQEFKSLKVSPIYRCPAYGFAGDDFLNLVVSAKSDLPIEQLFLALREIEFELGREQNSRKYSPRSLDIDLLMYDDFVGEVAGYQLPRSDIEKFAFVLKPLADLAAGLIHPIKKITVEQMWQDFSLLQTSQSLELVVLEDRPNLV